MPGQGFNLVSLRHFRMFVPIANLASSVDRSSRWMARLAKRCRYSVATPLVQSWSLNVMYEKKKQIGQPFTQKAAYRDLSSGAIYRMTEEQAHEQFCLARYGSTDVVECPGCRTTAKHYQRKRRFQWRCISCHRCFSVTTGTPFANRKLPFRKLLPVFYEFACCQKGASANASSGALDVTVGTSMHNFSKLREVLMLNQDKTPMHGLVQVDGGYFCGKPRKPNKKNPTNAAHVNSRLLSRKQSIIPAPRSSMEPWNQEKLDKRRVVIVLRQLPPEGSGRSGATRTITEVVLQEDAASIVPILNKYVLPGSVIQTDGGTAYRRMDPSKHIHQPVNHTRCYSTEEGWNNNQAESFFGRMRRSEFGVFHGMRERYVAMYAAEAAWREDTRRMTRSERFRDLIKKAMQTGQSQAFWRYKQGERLKGDLLFKSGGTVAK